MSVQQVKKLLDFIDNSPSPYHAVNMMVKKLQDYQFEPLDEKQKWSIKPGGRYYVCRDGSSLIFFVSGEKPLTETGYKNFRCAYRFSGFKNQT